MPLIEFSAMVKLVSKHGSWLVPHTHRPTGIIHGGCRCQGSLPALQYDWSDAVNFGQNMAITLYLAENLQLSYSSLLYNWFRSRKGAQKRAPAHRLILLSPAPQEQVSSAHWSIHLHHDKDTASQDGLRNIINILWCICTIHVYASMCVCVFIYIYIYTHTHTHTHTHTYTYIVPCHWSLKSCALFRHV